MGSISDDSLIRELGASGFFDSSYPSPDWSLAWPEARFGRSERVLDYL
jgi:hypothetical protein